MPHRPKTCLATLALSVAVAATLSAQPAPTLPAETLLARVDGTRTVAEIRDAVSAEFEPVDPGAVSEYLDVLAKVGAITFRK